jgi:hypothetical protein
MSAIASSRLVEFTRMFHVRSIYPDEGRVATSSFELTPTNPQAQAVCTLFEQYLSCRPAAFRDKLGFLRRGNFELDWSAECGGVALATMLQDGEVASMSVLMAGVQPQTDAMMLEVFRENVLGPLFDGEYDGVASVDLRPLVVEVIFPGRPEWAGPLHVLSASLASVYFRTVLQLSRPPDQILS